MARRGPGTPDREPIFPPLRRIGNPSRDHEKAVRERLAAGRFGEGVRVIDELRPLVEPSSEKFLVMHKEPENGSL